MNKEQPLNKGLLTDSHVYLVGALEYAKDGYSWRHSITGALSEMGIKVFDPNRDHFANLPTETEEDREALKAERNSGNLAAVKERMRAIIQRDLRMVDLSSFIIANIEPETPTFGSMHEIVVATQQNKAILIRTDDKTKFPLWLAGMVNVNLIFTTWFELIQYVRSIHSGAAYADPKYWKIITNE